ncbi:MAG: hypothetical protein AB1726_08070 [Planctomycetota bacterium]
MDFLLECIGFPPDYDLDALARRIAAEGEAVAWRGPAGTHLRLPLSGGVEVRLDREGGEERTDLWPHYEVRRRLRVAVQSISPLPDSPFDVLLTGIANPPLPSGDDLGSEVTGEDYPLATYLSDARRLPRDLPRGHVLAVSVCGFALDVTYLGPNEGVRDPYVLEEPCGALLVPLGGEERPRGAMEVSLRVREVRHLQNPLTGVLVDVLEADAPGRPLDLFVSRWQLETEGFPAPRPGWRIEGAFLFTGRVSGGLATSVRRVRSGFG